MRYWVLKPDGTGAAGPFETAALKTLPGFGPDSIVAPETASSADAWRPAKSFAELSDVFLRPPQTPPAPRREASASPLTQLVAESRPMETGAQLLDRCPDCGKEVSRKARICPDCGCPIMSKRFRKSKMFAALLTIFGFLLLPTLYLLIGYGTLNPCGALEQEAPRMTSEAWGLSSSEANILGLGELGSKSAAATLTNDLGEIECTKMLIQYKSGRNPIKESMEAAKEGFRKMGLKSQSPTTTNPEQARQSEPVVAEVKPTATPSRHQESAVPSPPSPSRPNPALAVAEKIKGFLKMQFESVQHLDGRLIPPKVEAVQRNGLYDITLYIENYNLEVNFNKHNNDEFIREIWIDAFGYGFEANIADKGYFKTHNSGFGKKIRQVVIKLFKVETVPAKYDGYGKMVQPESEDSKLLVKLTMNKGDSEKFDWDDIGNVNEQVLTSAALAATEVEFGSVRIEE